MRSAARTNNSLKFKAIYHYILLVFWRFIDGANATDV